MSEGRGVVLYTYNYKPTSGTENRRAEQENKKEAPRATTDDQRLQAFNVHHNFIPLIIYFFKTLYP